jgi:signal transduction histidine kinase
MPKVASLLTKAGQWLGGGGPRPKWHLVYFALAAFDLLAVAGGLVLNHKIMAIYEDSVAINQDWALRRSQLGELRRHALAVNAPGNDVFDSHDVQLEMGRQDAALREYGRLFAVLRHDFGFERVGTRALTLQARLDSIEAAMGAMLDEARLIFSYFSQGDTENAARRMATMDRKFASLSDAISDTARAVGTIQEGNFTQQIAAAAFLKRFEYLFGGIILLMVGAVTFYGHKIASAFKKAEQERAAHAAAMEEKDQALRRQIAELSETAATLTRLDRSLAEATSANSAKSAFLAHMSHELRTPLNAILGFSEVMKQEIFGPVGNTRYREYAADIHASGQHLLALINDILDLSKIEAGKAELHEEDCDAGQAIAEALRLVAASADAGGLVIDTHVAAGLPGLQADNRSLKQLLANLLSNAVKFTPRGGRVDITAYLRPSGEFAIAVRDTGIGMKPDQIPLALTPFKQLDNTLTRKHVGSGLGLPICASLIKLHGGRLEIDSAPGQGTTVTVVFPRQRVRTSEAPAMALAKAS